jgi:fibronectin type 3 domain-containing protein
VPGAGLHQLDLDFQQFVDSGTGPFADQITALDKTWNDALQQWG